MSTETTHIEYGVRFTRKSASVGAPRDAYPDEDGEIQLPGGGYSVGNSETSVRRLVSVYNARSNVQHVASVIERTITTGASRLSAEPLPSTPGSIIRATVTARNGTAKGVTLGLSTFSGGSPWVILTAQRSGLGGQFWVASSELSDVVVVHDEGANK